MCMWTIVITITTSIVSLDPCGIIIFRTKLTNVGGKRSMEAFDQNEAARVLCTICGTRV